MWYRTGSGDLWGDHTIPEPRAGRETFDGNAYGHTPAIAPLDFVIEREWLDESACADMMDLFERSADTRVTATSVREAKAVCASCPVRSACLDDAMASESGGHQHRWGIRGGLTGKERGDLWAEQQ